MARGPLVTSEEIIKWTQQFADGMTVSQIAKEAGRTYNTVKRIITQVANEMGIKESNSGGVH